VVVVVVVAGTVAGRGRGDRVASRCLLLGRPLAPSSAGVTADMFGTSTSRQATRSLLWTWAEIGIVLLPFR
jgi:hypothetical protein